MGVKRGDLVTIALQGDYGKPRPALVVQSDLFNEHPSVSVMPVTGDLRPTPLFRIDVEPTSENGLHKLSQVMVDKVQTVPREKVSLCFGHLEVATLQAVDKALARWFALDRSAP